MDENQRQLVRAFIRQNLPGVDDTAAIDSSENSSNPQLLMNYKDPRSNTVTGYYDDAENVFYVERFNIDGVEWGYDKRSSI